LGHQLRFPQLLPPQLLLLVLLLLSPIVPPPLLRLLLRLLFLLLLLLGIGPPCPPLNQTLQIHLEIGFQVHKVAAASQSKSNNVWI
jgi:hypothetical protein